MIKERQTLLIKVMNVDKKKLEDKRKLEHAADYNWLLAEKSMDTTGEKMTRRAMSNERIKMFFAVFTSLSLSLSYTSLYILSQIQPRCTSSASLIYLYMIWWIFVTLTILLLLSLFLHNTLSTMLIRADWFFFCPYSLPGVHV